LYRQELRRPRAKAAIPFCRRGSPGSSPFYEQRALRATAVGPNARRDFLAIGVEADGRQPLRPIDNMLAAPVEVAP
jgi:hypothetical protein